MEETPEEVSEEQREIHEIHRIFQNLDPDDEVGKAELVHQLGRLIKDHKFHYYQGSPLISDESYDHLEDILRQLSPDHPMLEYVGYNHHGKIQHQIPLLSLEKVREFKALVAWARKRHQSPSGASVGGSVEVRGTYKLDGVSLSLIYAGGVFLLAKTRGDGNYGEDVTDRLTCLTSIPKQLGMAGCQSPRQGFEQSYEIRGELCCSKKAFEQLAREMVSRGLKAPSSERNIVAGVLSRKDHHDLSAYFTFIAFNVAPIELKNSGASSEKLEKSEADLSAAVFATESEKLAFLDAAGFAIPPHTQADTGSQLISFSVGEEVAVRYLGGVLTSFGPQRPTLQGAAGVPEQLTGADIPSRLTVYGHLISESSIQDLDEKVYKIAVLLGMGAVIKVGITLSPAKAFWVALKMADGQDGSELAHISQEIVDSFRFCAYDFEGADDGFVLIHEQDKYEWLKEQGFGLSPSYESFFQFLKGAREYARSGEYGIDGVVLSFEDATTHQRIGYTSHHPKYRICYKWQGEEKPTKIADVLWEVSRTGFVTPIALLEPVKIGGATITRVSLHNYRYFQKLAPRRLDEVFVIRSGDVIPKITRIKRSDEPENKGWLAPEVCPECGHNLTHDLDSTDAQKASEVVALVCPNRQSCPPQVTGTINHWCRSVKIYDLSVKRIRQFVDLGLLTSIADLYGLKWQDLEALDGLKEKMAQKIVASIQTSKNAQLVDVLVGLGVTGMQKTMAKKIVAATSKLDQILAMSAEDFEDIEGIAEKSAQQMAQEIHELKPLVRNLQEQGLVITDET